MEKFKSIVGILIIGFVLCSCSFDSTENKSIGDRGGQDGVRGVVLPHHNLVGEYIDQFYSEIAEGEVDKILLISTNHFDVGYNYIQSAEDLDSTVKLQNGFINNLKIENVLAIEETGLNGEHGIMVHIDRIEDYFPEVPVIPIIIKWKTPQEKLDKLVEAILKEGNLDRTLIIASIDFSHFVKEETAFANDVRTVEWFESWGDGEISEISLDEMWALEKSIEMDTETATALDSPETLYVFANLIGQPKEVEVWKRTSSLSLFGGTNPMQNTSHLFVKVE